MIQSLRGTNDIYDEKSKLYKDILTICENIAFNYGYKYIETPKLEETSLFRRSVGESSDIVGKEMYEFTDKGGNDVCLRPEGTAGIVRAFIQAKFDKVGGVKKFFYNGSMFRYEKPQKGRLREFHQFGAECFGQGNVYEDASLIIMINEIFNKLEIKSKIKINSLGDSECMPIYKKTLIDFFDKTDGLCDDCLKRKTTNPIRILDCKNEKCQTLLKDAPIILDSLNEECKKDFDKLKEILKNNNINFEVDPKLVRGLDYYSKTTFEFISDEIGSQSAIAGGGRYDKLVEYLGGKPTFGVGFAIGIERIMEILSQKNMENKREGIYICSLDKKYLDLVYKIGMSLRKTFLTEISYDEKNLQKHLKQADNKNTIHFLCIGENEFANDEIWYKNLETKIEKQIKINDIHGELNDQ